MVWWRTGQRTWRKRNIGRDLTWMPMQLFSRERATKESWFELAPCILLVCAAWSVLWGTVASSHHNHFFHHGHHYCDHHEQLIIIVIIILIIIMRIRIRTWRGFVASNEASASAVAYLHGSLWCFMKEFSWIALSGGCPQYNRIQKNRFQKVFIKLLLKWSFPLKTSIKRGSGGTLINFKWPKMPPRCVSWT